MVKNPEAAKKPYRSPALVVLDVIAAKAKLESAEESGDPDFWKMLSLADEQLSHSKA